MPSIARSGCGHSCERSDLGGSRIDAAVLLVVLVLLALALVMTLFGLVYAGREAAEQDAGKDQYTIASGPHPGHFPLIFDSKFTPADECPQEILGLSEMDVIAHCSTFRAPTSAVSARRRNGACSGTLAYPLLRRPPLCTRSRL